jgi:proline iminopeptidase
MITPLLVVLTAHVSPGAPAREAPPASEDGYVAGADGVRLFVRKIVAGKALVVYLHGGPGQNFNGGGPEMMPLAAGRTLVLYDQRGAGRSEVVADPALLTAEHHVRDLDALRRHLGADRVSLIGLSWGSGLAALYAAAHPDRVERVVFVSPMPPARKPFWSDRLEKVQALTGPRDVARLRELEASLSTAGDQEIGELCREATAISLRHYVLDARRLHRGPGDRCDVPAAALRNRARVRDATLASLGDWDFRPLLARLPMPALVLEGAQTVVPLEATRAWTAALPAGRLLLLPNAGHELFVDQPEAFHRAVDRFLAGTYPRGAEKVRP